MDDENRKIIYPDLSYKLLGIAFKIFNELGFGFPEKHYQRALASEFNDLKINFKEQVLIPLKYKEKEIGRYFADFVVENKILLELKVINKLGYHHSKQVLGYLENGKIKLGILLYFTKDGVKYKRIINSKM